MKHLFLHQKDLSTFIIALLNQMSNDMKACSTGAFGSLRHRKKSLRHRLSLVVEAPETVVEAPETVVEAPETTLGSVFPTFTS
ncbi:MAG: hypothetical protein R6W78_10405 [Bacteroidales bacterium]